MQERRLHPVSGVPGQYYFPEFLDSAAQNKAVTQIDATASAGSRTWSAAYNILEAYPKTCFRFTDNFLRMTSPRRSTVSELGSEVGSEISSEIGSEIGSEISSEIGSEKASEKASEKTSEKILEVIQKNSQVTIAQLSNETSRNYRMGSDFGARAPIMAATGSS